MTHLVRRTARLVLTVAVLTTLGWAAAPAHAATSWHVDPTGDVQRYDRDSTKVVPSSTAWVDIVGVSAAYDATSLRVATSLRAYRGLSGDWRVNLRTSKGKDFYLTTSLQDGEVVLGQPNPIGGEPTFIDCDGLTVSRTDRGITATIPTTCVGSPWRLRFAVTAQATGRSGTAAGDGFTDHAFTDGRRPSRQDGPYLGSWLDQG